jgi:hypothetical protein
MQDRMEHQSKQVTGCKALSNSTGLTSNFDELPSMRCNNNWLA